MEVNVPGWESAIDPSTGRTYYINHLTQQTSWTPPVLDPLPNGWEERKDEQGRTFFYNVNTGTSQWDDPRIMGSTTSSSGNATHDDHGAVLSSSLISSNLNSHSAEMGNISYPSLSSGSGNQSLAATHGMSSLSTSPSTSTSNRALSTWECSKCTYQNSSSSESCIMCGASSSGAVVSTSSSTAVTGLSNSNVNGMSDAEYAASLQQEFDGEGDKEKVNAIDTVDDDDESLSIVNDPVKLKPYMVPDDSSKSCLKCHKEFSLFARRHHCKNCGMLACDACSAFKTKVPIADVGDKESRVCGWCYEQLTSGYKHCLLRYLLIVGEGSKERHHDRRVALQGIADCIEGIPRMVSTSATSVESIAVTRDLEVIDMVGGVARLCSFLEHDDPPEVQYEACRVLAAVANAAIAEPFGSQTLSKKNVANEFCQGTAPEVTKIILSRSSSISRSAQVYLVQFIYLLSDLTEIKQIARNVELIPAMCEFLLSSDEKLQDWSLLTLSKLMSGDGNNVDMMLKANGVHALALLLSSHNPLIQEHAATALVEALEVYGNGSAHDSMRANKVKDALLSLSGTTGAVSLMRSDNPLVARAGQKLMQLLSDSEAESLRSAGGVPLVVAQLATRDPSSQAQALQTLANMASVGAADRQAILESGGLAMAVPLLNDTSVESYKVRRFASILCEKYANDPNGALVIAQAGGIGFMVNIIRLQGANETYRDENLMTALHCASSISQMIALGSEYQMVIINSGAIEALLGMRGMDASIVEKTISSIYMFVSDENLLVALSKRIAPQMLAMKLVNLLNTSSGLIAPHVMEMLLLIVAILCGARLNDHIKNQNLQDQTAFSSSIERMLAATSAQTSELVLANGINLLLPLVNINKPPGVILAALRTLLAIATNAIQKTDKLIAAGAIGNIVSCMERSIPLADDQGEQVHQQIVLYSMTLFSTLCGRNGVRIALSPSQQSQVKSGIQVIASCLECNDLDLLLAGVRTLRECSFQSGNWDAVAEKALPRLMEMLLADKNQEGPNGQSLPSHIILQLLVDVAIITSNLAKLEKYCTMIRESGGIFALVGLLSEHEDDAVSLGVSTLIALSESSLPCREAIVQLNAVSTLLQLAEQRGSPLNTSCLQCVEILTKDPKHAALLSKKEPGAIDTLLRLNRFVGIPSSVAGNDNTQGSVSQYALAILLNIAQDEESALWDQLIINGDIQSCVNLLRIGTPKVQGNASLTLATICNGEDHGDKDQPPKKSHVILHTSQLNAVIEVIPMIINLLIPSDKLGSDKSESPAKEAANACYILSRISSIREHLIQANVVQSFCLLLLRERRLGRFRSATMESCLCALRSLCDASPSPSDHDSHNAAYNIEKTFWVFFAKSNNLSDGINAITMVIDSHIRDTSPTLIKVDPSVVAEAACHFLYSIPPNKTEINLSTADINLLGRAARPLTLAFDRKFENDNDAKVRQSALHAMTRLVKEDGLAAQLINAGCVKAACQSLVYVESSWERDSPTFVEASLLLSELVESTNDRIVFDAVVQSEAIPNLVALLVFATSSTNEHKDKEMYSVVDSTLRAISSLVSGGGRTVAKTLVESKDFISTLCSLLIDSDKQVGKHCGRVLKILAKIASLDEYRELLCTPAFNMVDSISLLLNTNKSDAEEENDKIKPKNVNEPTTVETAVDIFVNIATHLQDAPDEIIQSLISQLDSKRNEMKILVYRALHLLSMSNSDAVRAIATKEVFDSISQTCMSLQPTSKANVQETVLEALQLFVALCHHKAAREVCASSDDMFSAVAHVFVSTQNESIIVTAVASLLAVSLDPKGRIVIREINRGSLLKEIRRIYTSNVSGSYVGHQSLQLLKTLGDDLTRLQPAPSQQQPPNKLFKTLSSETVSSTTSSLASITPPIHGVNSTPSPLSNPGFFPQQQQTASPSLSALGQINSQPNFSQLPQQQQLQMPKKPQTILPPPPFPPPPIAQPPPPKPTLLPVFTPPQPVPLPKPSTSLSTLMPTRNTMVQNTMSDEELARRLQEEENATASAKKSPGSMDRLPSSSPMTSSSITNNTSTSSNGWSCQACTFLNSNSKSVCDVCQTPKPGSSTTSSTKPSSSSATIDVKCSSCKATLRVPSSAKVVRCPKCSATTAVPKN